MDETICPNCRKRVILPRGKRPPTACPYCQGSLSGTPTAPPTPVAPGSATISSPSPPPVPVGGPPAPTLEIADDPVPTGRGATGSILRPRHWTKPVWIGVIAGLLIGMIAMVLILSMERTPDVDGHVPDAAPAQPRTAP